MFASDMPQISKEMKLTQNLDSSELIFVRSIELVCLPAVGIDSH